MFKVNNKTPERHYSRRSSVFIVNFEHISYLFSVSIVDFAQVNVNWVADLLTIVHKLAGIYLLKFNNESTRTIYKICSKLAIKTPKRLHWRHIVDDTSNDTFFWYFHCWFWTSKYEMRILLNQCQTYKRSLHIYLEFLRLKLGIFLIGIYPHSDYLKINCCEKLNSKSHL